MFQPELWPLGSHALTAIVALLPLLTVFVLLGGLRWKAHWAGLSAVAVAILVAIFAYKMPVGMTISAAFEGAAFGLFPILWIVLTAVWLYELTVVSGRFEHLRGAIYLITDDPRILAVLIAFGFGALLEALAGFGAPVAITGVMLMAVGYPPLRAAITVLLANTAPVAFGALAIPIITAGNLTHIPYTQIGAYVGHQTPLLAWAVPMLLVIVADGVRGLKETLPATLTVGITFSIAQWFASTFISVELTDVIASLVALAAGVILMRFWKPKGTAEAHDRLLATREAEAAAGYKSGEQHGSDKTERPTTAQIWMALFPYLVVVALFTISKMVPVIKDFLASTDVKIKWPGIAGKINTTLGAPNGTTTYVFSWLSSPGSLLLISGIIVAIGYRIPAGQAIKTLGQMIYKMRWTILTIASVLALAYVMNLSGQTYSVGVWIASVGGIFAFFSPILGWIGTAVTGSDTSANALFSTLQQAAGQSANIDPTLLVSANTAGGVVGKMISPQNLAIAATAVGLAGKESDIFRNAMKWSLGLLLALCIIIGLQSTPVLSWILPTFR